MSLNIIFSLIFMRLFESVGWMPHGGLALANSLATALETIGLIILIRRKMQRINAGRILSLTWRSLLAGAVMAAALWGWLLISGGLPNWVTALAGITAGALVYFVIIRILRVEEVSYLFAAVRRRLGLAGER
jgi:putative peptidoglycan lipid II flippase